ncbi:unnamed protein product [Ambrosiozyma monospora]|uniref:Unnamed protein product n=1 Tax=Ambrosiozyma monospora TaxID=43982 RepID=A0ACB5T931_AMBMO|nr:unnamed protein product [Ambrosiozyma monospora]
MKALQVRLNISYIQDWLRTNDLTPFRAPDFDFNDPKYPDSIVHEKISLKNVARFGNNPKDPMDATFYYSSLYKIGQHHLQPVVELLEWLQIMTGLKHDLTSFKETVNNFQTLNSTQILKSVKNYNYEVDESKFSSQLKSDLKKHPFDAKQPLFYTSLNKDFINTGQVFPVTLPNLIELLHQYGGDLKEYDLKKLKLYQPNLPIEIEDDLDDLYDRYGKEGENYGDDDANDTFQNSDDDGDDVVTKVGGTSSESPIPAPEVNAFTRDVENREYFSSIAVPSGIAQKTWVRGIGTQEDNVNPWA